MSKVELSELKGASYNPRNITEQALEKLKASIKTHTKAIVQDSTEGFRMASTVTVNRNGNRIVGGHQRIKALRSLGQNWIHNNDITWVEVEPDSAAEKALNYSLNDDGAQGEWDDGLANEMLQDIKDADEEMFNELMLEENLNTDDDETGSVEKDEIESGKPEMTWTLVGCPIEEYSRLSEHVANLESNRTEGTVIVKTTSE